MDIRWRGYPFCTTLCSIWHLSAFMKYKESIVNFLNTVLMKTFLNYLFVLCPSIVIYGCSNDDKDRQTRPHSDNFWENSAKCLRTIEICSFVPDSSICGFWPFLRELGKQIATYPLPFPGWKRGLEIASISTFHILFITAWNDVSCYVYHANLVIFFRIRKKDRVCLLGEGPYSPFRYIFHAIHLLAI